VPELPDIEVYVECLQRRIVGATLDDIQLRSPFVLRTVIPSWRECLGREVTGVSRLGKRIVVALTGELRLVFHLMRLGRLHWAEPGGGKLPGGKVLLATFAFSSGKLAFIEVGSKKRASLHVLSGDEAVRALDRGGLEVMQADAATMAQALRRENHTIKRALTDPRILSGIGNAYSDEILHAARLSPVTLTQRMSDEDYARLHAATREVLQRFLDTMRREVGEGFPTKVTAFRDDMAVHGRFGKPCPVCEAPVQRIVYADRETNYCARCQTDGRRLADRALSRLLGKDFPRTLDDLEDRS